MVDSYKYEKRDYWINHQYKQLSYIDTTKLEVKAREHIVNAGIERMKENFAMAIIEYQQALRLDTSASIYYAIADCYRTLGRASLSIEYAMRALHIEPAFIPAYELLVVAYINNNDVSNAILTLEHLIAMEETELRLSVLANIFEFRDINKADSIYTKLAEKYQNELAINKLAQQYLLVPSVYDVKEVFEQLWIKDEKNWRYPYWLGIFKYDVGYNEEALLFLNAAYEIDTNKMEVLQIIAEINDALGNYNVSDSIYEKILNKEPNNPIISNNYAYTLSQRKLKLDYALDLAKVALNNNPTSAVYLDTYGWVLFQMGDYRSALESIEQSIIYDDDNYETYAHLAEIHYKLENFIDSHKALEKALEIHPTDATLLEKKELLQNILINN
jgi:tetratricopeptide (TPR) repeat protein